MRIKKEIVKNNIKNHAESQKNITSQLLISLSVCDKITSVSPIIDEF